MNEILFTVNLCFDFVQYVSKLNVQMKTRPESTERGREKKREDNLAAKIYGQNELDRTFIAQFVHQVGLVKIELHLRCVIKYQPQELNFS